MLKKSRVREKPMEAIAVIGAVWLITLFGVAVYAEKMPAPTTTASAECVVARLAC